MTHWLIIVPGWGTVYGIGTRRQAEEVARFRAKPMRGTPIVTEALPEMTEEWTNLTDMLLEILDE